MKINFYIFLLLIFATIEINSAARFENSSELLKKRYDRLVENLDKLRQQNGIERFRNIIEIIEVQLANLSDISHSTLDEISAIIFKLEKEFKEYITASGPENRDKIAKQINEFKQKLQKTEKYITHYKVKPVTAAQKAKIVLAQDHDIPKVLINIVNDYAKENNPERQINADIDLARNLPKNSLAIVAQYARGFTAQEIALAKKQFNEAYEKIIYYYRQIYLQSFTQGLSSYFSKTLGLTALEPTVNLHEWLLKADWAIYNGADVRIQPHNILFLDINDIRHYPNLLEIYQLQKSSYMSM